MSEDNTAISTTPATLAPPSGELRYLVVTFLGDETLVHQTVIAAVDGLHASDPTRVARKSVITNGRDPYPAAPEDAAAHATALRAAGQTAAADYLEKLAGQYNADRAELHGAIDKAVHGHPDCKAGRLMTEHTDTILASVKEHQTRAAQYGHTHRAAIRALDTCESFAEAGDAALALRNVATILREAKAKADKVASGTRGSPVK